MCRKVARMSMRPRPMGHWSIDDQAFLPYCTTVVLVKDYAIGVFHQKNLSVVQWLTTTHHQPTHGSLTTSCLHTAHAMLTPMYKGSPQGPLVGPWGAVPGRFGHKSS